MEMIMRINRAKKVSLTQGVITLAPHKCECGGYGKIQEWLEPDNAGNFKRYCKVFCDSCDKCTRIYCERTARESRECALREWDFVIKQK